MTSIRRLPSPWRGPAAAAFGAALLLCATLWTPLVPAVDAFDTDGFEDRVTSFTLDNGWTFILFERPGAPVFSFATLADVGGAQEVPGITGLAHMFEHMAFKGTPNIGTTDYEAEKEALEEMEAAYQAWQAERLAPRPDPERLETLRATFEEKQEAAQAFVVPNEFSDLIDREGGVGLNAFTSADVTGYFYSLPSNKFELFAFLESERFLHPVFREYYTERDVVMEERRLRTDSQPIGRLVEQWLSAAYVAHPYGQPVVGYMSDLESITLTDAREFFETHYGPSNLITTIVGDIDPDQVRPIIERYFGRIPARPAPPPLRTVEPPQIAEKEIVLTEAAQPIYIEGYHRPAQTHPDHAAWAALDSVLARGRTSRLNRRLVQDDQLAVEVGTISPFPGPKYPNQWIILAVAAPGASNQDIQAAIHEELERVVEDGVTAEELERFKTRAKADLIRGLESNFGLALELAEHQRLFGDWRELFDTIERIEAVTAEDVQRVARQALTETNRTIGRIETARQTASEGADGASASESR